MWQNYPAGKAVSCSKLLFSSHDQKFKVKMSQAVLKSTLPGISFKGWAPSKLTCSENDFAHFGLRIILMYCSRKFFLRRSSVQIIFPA